MSSSRKSLFFNRCQQAPVPRNRIIDKVRVKLGETNTKKKLSGSRWSDKRQLLTGDTDSLSSYTSSVALADSRVAQQSRFLCDLEVALSPGPAASDHCNSEQRVPAPQACPPTVNKENMWKTKRSHSLTSPHSVVKDHEEQQPVQFEATQLWDAMVAHLERNVSPGRRMRSFRWYQDCFHGSEAVDCLKAFFTKILQRTGVERQNICILLGRFNSWGVIEAVTSRDQNCTFRECNLYRLTFQHFWRSEDTKTRSLRRSHSIPSLAPGGDPADDSGLTSPSSIQSTSSEEKIKTLPRTCSSLSLDHGFHDGLLSDEADEKHAVASSSDSEAETMALEADPSPLETRKEMRSRRYSHQRDSEAARRARKGAGKMETSGKRIRRQRSMLEEQSSHLKLSKRMSGSCGTLCDDATGRSLATTNSAEGCTRWHPKANVENKQPSYSKQPVVRQERTRTAEAGKMPSHKDGNAVNHSATSKSAERDLRRQERMSRHQARNATAHVKCIQDRRSLNKQQSSQNDLGAVKSTTSKGLHRHSRQRKHCDLHRRLAASGQLSSAPVAYGDFGALAMSDVMWQQFCFPQDMAAPLKYSPVGMFSSAPQRNTDMQIVCYGFV